MSKHTAAIDPLVLLSRLNRRLVRCTDQAECYQMEAEIAALQAQIDAESPAPAVIQRGRL